MKMTTKAFIFGKFLPFHKGHEAMIRFALTHCDFLTVLICSSDQENTPATQRKRWIEQTITDTDKLHIRIFQYDENQLPKTSVSSLEVSRIWSEKFKILLPDHNLVITSEPYGDFVASFMGIRHIAFDKDRKLHPFSATSIRQNLQTNWDCLPPAVKSDFAKKVVILGTESTGKSTLTLLLARHFDCTAVPEAARDLITDSNSFTMNDLYLVAIEHAKRIDAAVIGKSPLVIIDTDIYITQSYALFTFGKAMTLPQSIYASNKADLYLYLRNDVPHQQDGTRLHEANRNALDQSHQEVLKRYGIDFVEIGGTWDERFDRAVELIAAM